jgi:hypothetical protein
MICKVILKKKTQYFNDTQIMNLTLENSDHVL